MDVSRAPPRAETGAHALYGIYVRQGVPSTRVEAVHGRFMALRGAKTSAVSGRTSPAWANLTAVQAGISAYAGSSTRVEGDPTSLDDVSLESVEQEAGNGATGARRRRSLQLDW